MDKTWSTHEVIEKYILQSHKKITVKVSLSLSLFFLFISPLVQLPISGQGHLIAKVSRLHTDTQHSEVSSGR
jgi:hypothetical protein